MSAELVVKKRGRPKKVIAEPLEAEILDLKSSASPAKSSRAKSTKAAPKPATTKKVAATKVTKAEKSTIKPEQVQKSATKPAAAPAPPTTSPIPSEPNAQEMPTRTPVTPETSKILKQVRELSTESIAQDSSVSQATRPPPTGKSSAAQAKPIHAQSTISNTSSNQSNQSNQSNPSSSPPTQARATPQPTTTKSPSLPISNNAPPPPKPKIPIAAINSAVVSNISERAGARPNIPGSKALPKGYQSAARRITMTIVALPIAIVTSYVLYQRLVLGEEKQLLTVPRWPDNEASPKTSNKDEGSKGQES